MANFTISISTSNVVGATSFKVKYRLINDSTWNSYLINASSTISGSTFTGLNNRIYQIQVQNLNGSDNPLSQISEGIGFTNPTPVISVTSTNVGYSFNNLSVDIDSYTAQLTTVVSPGVIIATHNLSAGSYPNIVTDTFTGLSGSTAYRLIITPVANQYSEPFVYTFITASGTFCADPNNVTASIV